MGVLTFAQVQKLLIAISRAAPDELDCDGCFELVADLAEAERRGDELSEALKAVHIHFSQCPCCAYEYATLLEALHAAESLDQSR